MDRWSYSILDVFSSRPLAGNQLAVFEDAVAIPEHVLLPLAQEIGFSETVFLYPGDEEADAVTRIFTPGSEIPFAGHPVLGTAIVKAAETGQSQVRLKTGRGVVPVSVEPQGSSVYRSSMTQPVPTVSVTPGAEAILSALGVARSELPVMSYDNGVCHTYVVLPSRDDVAAVRPDLQALTQIARELPATLVGFNVTAGSGSNWKTRMFAPAAGVSEDPATGSAAGPLAMHLARLGLIDWGQEIIIEQGTEIGRPSELRASASLTNNVVGPIVVSGSGVIVGGGWFAADLLLAS